MTENATNVANPATVIEGVCAPIAGEEENYLAFFDGRTLGATRLLPGVETLPWNIETAFQYPDDPRFAEVLIEYRIRTGRRFPPAYRVRIDVRFEPVPDDEAAKLWESLKRKVDEDP